MLNKGFHPDTVAKALDFFDRALSLDPDNVDILAGSARADTFKASALGANIAAAFASGEAKLTRALSRLPDHARAHGSLGGIYIFTKRAAQGVAECEHALTLDRNLAHAHASMGMGKLLIGRPEETEAHIRDAIRLSPKDTQAYLWLHWEGLAKICLGLWDPAVETYRRSIEANFTFWVAHVLLAAALAQLDRWDESRVHVKSGLALNPAMSVSRARALWTAFSDDPAFLAALEPVFDVLHKAGLPQT